MSSEVVNSSSGGGAVPATVVVVVDVVVGVTVVVVVFVVLVKVAPQNSSLMRGVSMMRLTATPHVQVPHRHLRILRSPAARARPSEAQKHRVPQQITYVLTSNIRVVRGVKQHRDEGNNRSICARG